MTPAPLISVIVPVYNVANHVVACLESLKRQSLSDFECLVIDDGATDDSAALAAMCIAGDPRFRLIEQDNLGLSAARNTGLEAARGAYIAFVDSDDRVMPDFLLRLWQALEDTGADWVACAISSTFPDGRGTMHSALHDAPDLSRHTVPRRWPMTSWPEVIRHFPSAWNKLYRRRLIDGLRFDEGTWFEDHGFFLRAAARTDHILHLPEPLYLQTRGRAGQITAADDDRVFQQIDVLHGLRERMQAGSKPGGSAAFATLASRLLFERSTALRHPGRRARFATAARAFLLEQGLSYVAGAQGRAWGLEIEGTTPLSVVIPWDGRDGAAVLATLSAVAEQCGPGLEIILSCPRHAEDAARRLAPGTRITSHAGTTLGAACAAGLEQARGLAVIFLRPGDRPAPVALLDATEMLLREDGDLVVMAFRDGTQDDASGHDGFVDLRPFSGVTPPPGILDPTPEMALGLHPELSAKLFRRAFLLNQGLEFSKSQRGHWPVVLGAALLGRTAYLNWPAIAVAPRPGGTGRLMRDHMALVRALPDRVAAALPTGWQRRLFARALRQNADTATTRVSAVRLALSGVGAALCLGVSGTRPLPAGFDPAFGPRLARLLNPLGGFGGAAPNLQTTEATGGDAGTDDPDDDALRYLLPSRGRAALRLRADFHDHAYANLSLIGSRRNPTPFHLSLRINEGLLVCNDRRADGRWRAERRRECRLPRAGCEVCVLVEAPRVRVLIDGTEVMRLSRRTAFNRSGLRGLTRVTGFTLEGGLRLVDALSEFPDTAPVLTDRLQIVLPRPAQASAAALSLDTGAGRLTLPVTSLDFPGTPPMLQATLPGRAWKDLPDHGELRLRLRGPGGLRGPALNLTQSDMSARMVATLDLDPAAEDTDLVLPLLEQAREPDLWHHLPDSARRRLHGLARVYGLADALPPGPPPPAPQPDSDIAAIDLALARFAESQRADPAPDPLAVLDGLKLPSIQAQQGLFLALSEVFCRTGQDTDGFVARAAELPAFTPSGDVWTDSAMLPFLLLSDQPETAAEVLETLVAVSDKWILTPPIAFMARRVLSDPRIGGGLRDTILYNVMSFVDRRSEDYWERAHCAELTNAVVAVLAAYDRLSWFMQRDLERFCIAHYGTSRLFWAQVAAHVPSGALPNRIVQARAAFSDLLAASETGDPRALDAAVTRLHQMGCVETRRLRRELLGPAGVPLIPGAPPLADALLSAPEGEQAALRYMAAPGTPPVPAAVAEMARRALPGLYPELARAPLFERQLALSKAAGAALAEPSPSALEHLDGLVFDLADAASHFLGIGAAFAVIAAHPDRTEPLQTRLAAFIAARNAIERQALWAAPMVVQTTARLPAGQRALLSPAALPETGPVPAENPLYDAIVVVFSCQAYLQDRIPALRKGWLSRLAAYNVPYVIVVGDGDGRQDGDIVYLDAPDDYEGLPQKTLASIAWVQAHTRHAHMIKVDDDCFLNVDLFFGSLNYRKFDYYGRKLTRVPGQMDRAWHQAKSVSPRGRTEFDRSPEPSSYADGGSGYALSRRAMQAALDAAASAQGRRLIQASFMEDKLVGDLLALRGIAVSDEDYRVTVRRRSHRDAIPVASWLNSFLPSPDASIMLAHLDTHHDQPAALAGLATPGLRPKKIWPGFQDVRLGYQSNALELVSDKRRVDRAAAAPVAVVACMRNEMFMLPVFLDHYRRLGVDAFLIADNGSDDGTLEYLAAQPDVALFSVDTDYNRSHYGVAWQQALMAAFRVGKWSLVADADELLVWQRDQRQTLPDLLTGPAFDGAEAARIFMLDMYPQGQLEAADFRSGDPFAEAGFADRVPFLTRSPTTGPYTDAPCWTSALRHRLIPGSRPNLFVAQKLALLRYHPFMRLSAGLHFVGDARLSERELIFAHFKYNADFRRKAQAEVARGQHWGNAEEYRKYLALSSEGRSVIFDPALSVPWTEAPFVAARLDAG